MTVVYTYSAQSKTIHFLVAFNKALKSRSPSSSPAPLRMKTVSLSPWIKQIKCVAGPQKAIKLLLAHAERHSEPHALGRRHHRYTRTHTQGRACKRAHDTYIKTHTHVLQKHTHTHTSYRNTHTHTSTRVSRLKHANTHIHTTHTQTQQTRHTHGKTFRGLN